MSPILAFPSPLHLPCISQVLWYMTYMNLVDGRVKEAALRILSAAAREPKVAHTRTKKGEGGKTVTVDVDKLMLRWTDLWGSWDREWNWRASVHSLGMGTGWRLSEDKVRVWRSARQRSQKQRSQKQQRKHTSHTSPNPYPHPMPHPYPQPHALAPYPVLCPCPRRSPPAPSPRESATRKGFSSARAQRLMTSC